MWMDNTYIVLEYMDWQMSQRHIQNNQLSSLKCWFTSFGKKNSWAISWHCLMVVCFGIDLSRFPPPWFVFFNTYFPLLQCFHPNSNFNDVLSFFFVFYFLWLYHLMLNVSFCFRWWLILVFQLSHFLRLAIRFGTTTDLQVPIHQDSRDLFWLTSVRFFHQPNWSSQNKY